MTRVLIVIPGLGPDGGAERSLAAATAGLVDRGFDLHVALLTDRHGLVPELERLGAIIHDLSRSGGLVGRVRGIRSLIRRLRPDVVHASLFDASVVSQLAVMGTGVPVLVTWANTSYGAAGEPGTHRWKLKAIDLLETVLGRLSHSWYHAVTPAVGRITGGALHVDPSRVLVGERGRDPDQFPLQPVDRTAVPRGLDVPPGARVVLAVGRQDNQKGYEDLLVAFDRLRTSHPDVHLVVAGREGSATPGILAVHAAMLHPGSVHLAGQRDDVPALMRRADVVVCSSWREGAAGALIEAMACGRPVVAVPIAGLEGILVDGRNSLVVPRGELAEGLARVLDDPELAAKLGASGRQMFEERFTTAASVERIAEIYRHVATA